jgi:hypothetical protein
MVGCNVCAATIEAMFLSIPRRWNWGTAEQTKWRDDM